MKIVENRGIHLYHPHPTQITTVIPKSKQIAHNEVLVHWGLEETQVLRNLNYDVPSPITSQYKWPGRYTPFDNQKATAAFLTLNRRAYCFSEMGTGKTASAIWAADYLISKGFVKRVLVLCPLSIMSSAWADDLFTFAMHRTVDVAHGTAVKRKKLIKRGAEFVIINYEGVEVVIQELLAGEFDLIIVDEANHYKNPRTTRWKMLNTLVKHDTWLWLMTGTPAAQSPVDAYGLAKLVNPKSVPAFYGSFRDQVMRRVTQFKWVPKPNAKDVVHNILQPAIRFTKEECLDLPEITYAKRAVEMTPQQKKYYNDLKQKMRIQAVGETVTAANAAINLNKLLQISSGAVYTDEGETLEFQITHRYRALREVIDETNQKVLVFAPFKHIIRILVDKLTKDGITADKVDGSVGATTRTELFRQFQSADTPRVLVIQPQAASHGVTLTAADTIVWWGPTPSLETWLQANARIHRAGQRHPCTVVQLQGSNVESHIYNLLATRQDVHTQIIDLYKEALE